MSFLWEAHIRRYNIQQNNTLLNDNKQNDLNDIQNNSEFICYAESRFFECQYADCYSDGCWYAEYHPYESVCWLSLSCMSLCWVSFLWMSVCWVLFRWMSLYWMSRRQAHKLVFRLNDGESHSLVSLIKMVLLIELARVLNYKTFLRPQLIQHRNKLECFSLSVSSALF